MPASEPMIDLLFVITPHSLLLDIAGAAEAFRLANLHAAARNTPPRFRLRFAGHEPAVDSSVGLRLAALEPLPSSLTGPTWVILVGQPNAEASKGGPAIEAAAAWLHHTVLPELLRSKTAHRLITICSGALLAARAGLLDGRRCTTHHDMQKALCQTAPRAQLVRNRVFMIDGPVASSAGITAGIDLSAVADDMVVYLRRSSRDPEVSPFRVHRNHLHAAVHKVQDAINADHARGWDMPALAALGHVSERHLLRLFLENAGVSPLIYLQSIRLERARQLIEHGEHVTCAAELAGFSSSLQLRRAWTRQWGGSPRDAVRIAASKTGFRA